MLLHAYGMGGTIRTVVNQANAMAAAGHEVEIVSAVRRRDEPQFRIDPRVRLSTLVDQREGDRQKASLRRRVLVRLGAGHAVPKGEFASDWFTHRVEEAVERYVAGLTDGILVTTRPGLNILAARAARPGLVMVAQEHMNLATHRDDVREAIARHYSRFQAVVVLTRTDQADYRRLLPGTRIECIPNAVHSLDQKLTDHSRPIVVAAGRLLPQKGFDLLIPAFAKVVERYPDWQLRIFGSGEKKDELRALIEELHLYNHVFLMGRSERFDEELAKASVFVLSSRFEGLPMVMIEAMTHALPVVSFDCPTGPADVIEDGVSGFLVPPKDVDGLAEAMMRLLGDRELRRRMGAAARKAVADYAPDVVMPRWERLFAELSAARTPAGRG